MKKALSFMTSKCKTQARQFKWQPTIFFCLNVKNRDIQLLNYLVKELSNLAKDNKNLRQSNDSYLQLMNWLKKRKLILVSIIHLVESPLAPLGNNVIDEHLRWNIEQ